VLGLKQAKSCAAHVSCPRREGRCVCTRDSCCWGGKAVWAVHFGEASISHLPYYHMSYPSPFCLMKAAWDCSTKEVEQVVWGRGSAGAGAARWRCPALAGGVQHSAACPAQRPGPGDEQRFPFLSFRMCCGVVWKTHAAPMSKLPSMPCALWDWDGGWSGATWAAQRVSPMMHGAFMSGRRSLPVRLIKQSKSKQGCHAHHNTWEWCLVTHAR
jgi:hypothetical protein